MSPCVLFSSLPPRYFLFPFLSSYFCISCHFLPLIFKLSDSCLLYFPPPSFPFLLLSLGLSFLILFRLFSCCSTTL